MPFPSRESVRKDGISDEGILLVEDNRAIREAVAALLEHQGHCVSHAGNGQEALEALTTSRPNLVLLDLMMPVMDGWTFLDIKERDLALADIPVVIYSAVAHIHPPRSSRSVVATIDKTSELQKLFALAQLYCGAGRARVASSF